MANARQLLRRPARSEIEPRYEAPLALFCDMMPIIRRPRNTLPLLFWHILRPLSAAAGRPSAANLSRAEIELVLSGRVSRCSAAPASETYLRRRRQMKQNDDDDVAVAAAAADDRLETKLTAAASR